MTLFYHLVLYINKVMKYIVETLMPSLITQYSESIAALPWRLTQNSLVSELRVDMLLVMTEILEKLSFLGGHCSALL